MRKKIDKLGNIFYINENNQYHREDGPSIESINGNKFWYKNGVRHREDGPAIEYSNGNKLWCKNGKCHRENGPAVELANGNKKYWYNNIYYPEIKTDEEWIRFVKLMVFL